VTVFRFIEREKADFPVRTMCRVLEVSPSGYWAWSKRAPSQRARSDAELTLKIGTIHKDSRGTYGVPRVHAELRDSGTRCSRKRVARLMRAAGLEGVHRRRFVRTTVQDRHTAPAPDLVERLFAASCPDALWVADITYVPTWQGFLYVAVVLDVFSRRIVGWSMAGHQRTDLILDALDMAIVGRRPADGLIHHSDRGTQLGFKESSQHCLVRTSVNVRRGPRLGSSSRGSSVACYSAPRQPHPDRLESAC
jgi:putative transposase